MLFPPPNPPENPHAPFVYRDGEIRYTAENGSLYEADVWPVRDGWRWSATWTPPDAMDDHAGNATASVDLAPNESAAVTDAVAWLRGRL